MRDTREPYDWRSDVRARLAGAGLRPEDEAQIVEEVGHHLEQQFAEMVPRIGRAAAREALLSQLQRNEFDDALAGRRRRATPSRARVWSSSSIMHDIRYGLRSLRRSPGTLVAGSTALALGIGLTTTMFSVIYGLLIKGLPYDEPSRIAVVKFIDPTRPGVDALVPLGDLTEYRARQRSFESLGGYAMATVNVSGGDRPDRVAAARVTTGVLGVTRVRPDLGRTLGEADFTVGAHPTAVLSHALWRDRFASDPGALGGMIQVDGRWHTIVGIMPPGFEFPATTRVWLPLPTDPAPSKATDPGVSLIGRLRPDVPYDNANAEFKELARQVAAARPAADSSLRIAVLPFVRASVNPRVYTLLYAMLGAVFLVLIVACANVANLLLDRAVNRSREIGIRTALGASRLAVMRQSLVESGILALIAACLGVVIAQLGITLFNRAVAQVPGPPFWMDIRLHPPVLAFVVAVAVGASLVSGLLPAIQASRLDVAAILKDESHGASSLRVGRLSRTIVVVQIAVSSAVLLASGFVTRTIVNLRNVDPRFETRGITTARVTLATQDTTQQRAFFEALDREVEKLPGGEGAYIGSGLPGTGWSWRPVSLDGETYRRDRDHQIVRTLSVTPGFFQTFGVHVLRGRAIGVGDRGTSDGVAVVSESFARRVLHGRDPLGARFRLSVAADAPWVTVVGVIPTLFSSTIEDPWPAEVLTSFWQQGGLASAALAYRGVENGSAAASLRKIVAAIDPEVPVYGVQSMSEVIAQPRLFFDVFATMFIVFGLVALALSAIGLYAVMTFSVSRRAREMGIRLALGATAGSVLGLILRQGARQTSIGMAIGFLAGLLLVRAIAAALFGVRPGDPLVLLAVAGVLGGSAAIACLVPARRATRVDPVVALRSE
jgi:putative ABC transport system permease protein